MTSWATVGDPAPLSELAKENFMAQAVAESYKALPACRPNPPVGCVIVCGNEILARGYTGAPGEPHAEAAAISALPCYRGSSVDLVAFVTLEPCSFFGRTPSCAKALIELGIGSVVVGLIDPDPRNSGKGIQLLREAGVHVELGVLSILIDGFLRPYLIGPRAADLPRMRLWFKRGSAYTHYEVEQSAGGMYELRFVGPDGLERTERFHDSEALCVRKEEIETELRVQGWRGPRASVP